MTLTENKTRGKEYKEKQKTALTLYNNFIETLSEKQIIMFEEVLDNLFELNDEFAQKDFKQGFKLGFTLHSELSVNNGV